jgi:hypothetical protein
MLRGFKKSQVTLLTVAIPGAIAITGAFLAGGSIEPGSREESYNGGMDTQSFLKSAFDKTGYQVKMVFDGLTDLDTNPIPAMFSPREQLAHLWEVYQAVLTLAAGGKHPWGEFEIPDSIKSNAYEECMRARQAACEKILELDEEQALKFGMDFIVEHDAYHVGQMCSMRLALDPEWNAYSIYQH